MQILFLASYIWSDDDDRFTFKVFERFRVRRRFSATRITGSYHATYLLTFCRATSYAIYLIFCGHSKQWLHHWDRNWLIIIKFSADFLVLVFSTFKTNVLFRISRKGVVAEKFFQRHRITVQKPYRSINIFVTTESRSALILLLINHDSKSLNPGCLDYGLIMIARVWTQDVLTTDYMIYHCSNKHLHRNRFWKTSWKPIFYFVESCELVNERSKV